MADPVAEKSGFLRMYMSGHPDTLVAYAKYFGKVEEQIKSAEMTAIECKCMTLRYTTPSGKKNDVVVKIDPPLRGYEDVKPRLLEMKAQAQEGLGMIKFPRITTFQAAPALYGLTLATVVFWYLAYFAPSTLAIPLPDPVAKIAGTNVYEINVYHQIFIYIVQILAVTHVLESLYTGWLCYRHTDFTVGALYVSATLLGGFTVWMGLRQRIQEVRIESVMKVQ